MCNPPSAAKLRYTLIISAIHQRQLAGLAKQHKLSQAEVIECMLDHIDLDRLAPCFEQRRADKVARRVKKKGLIAMLAKLPADKLAAITAECAESDE